MNSRFTTTTTTTNPFVSELEDSDNSPQHGGDSPPSTTSADHKIASSSSPKRNRRAIQKRVVSIPIKDVDGSRVKGETAPPSDSWAWRKYGQKPIKGSPYPRGYYRCSSSKGCPARKQVERSRVDPTMLVVTYTSEHNHPLPASKNHHNSTPATTTTTTTTSTDTTKNSEQDSAEVKLTEPDPDEKFAELREESLITTTDEFGWFADMESTSSTRMLDSPIFAGATGGDADVAMFFPAVMREEDESLFADLGELPECSLVFRREVPRNCMTSSWCGTTS